MLGTEEGWNEQSPDFVGAAWEQEEELGRERLPRRQEERDAFPAGAGLEN